MTDDDLGYRRYKPETYEEILARAVCLQPEAELTEAERAERFLAGRERTKRHDQLFAAEYLTLADERLVSRELAKSLGYTAMDDRLGMAETGDD